MIITRRFWPYAGTTEQGVAWLAQQLVDDGHQVEIVSIAWEKDWPAEFHYQGASVARLPRPVSGPWGSHRYLKGLGRKLQQGPEGVVVFGLGPELHLLARQGEAAIPFLVYLDESQERLSPKDLQALASAQSIITMSNGSRERLLSQVDLPPERVQVAPFPIAVENEPDSRLSREVVRVILSEAHPMLRIEPNQPLVVAAAPLLEDAGWDVLLACWQRVVQARPDARLWIPGHDLEARLIWDRVIDLGLMHQVIMPGQFDCLDELLAAADLVVGPMHAPRHCPGLLRAAELGICPVVAPAMLDWLPLEDQVSGVVLPPQEPPTWAALLLALLADEPARQRMGLAASAVVATIDAPAADRYVVQPLRDARQRPATSP